MNRLNLTLGILTYNAPRTLDKTLNSIFSPGVNTMFSEVLLYVNPSEVLEQTLEVSSRYQIKTQVAEDNGWIGPGFKWLVENSESDNILLLEDDFGLIEDNLIKVFKILKTSVEMIQTNVVDKVRLRHRANPGNPLYSRWFAGQEHLQMSHLAECVHWRQDPDLNFPEFCTKINSDPVWYKFKAANCNFTNNPAIFSREFYKKHIIPQFCNHKTDIETSAHHWWLEQNFSIAAGDGLFCHDRLDGK
jgi:glycosyltransferase involved in cell wall biosynthesis